MNSTAVIKPDHIGDFILSLPAFRAILAMAGKFDLFTASSNKFLVNHFFGETVRFIPCDLPHLQKTHSPNTHAPDLFSQLQGYSSVIYLRDDGYLNDAPKYLSANFYSCKYEEFTHETEIQRRALADFVGTYSRTSHFSRERICWPTKINTLGISISAGFTTNKIPLSFWNLFIKHIKAKYDLRLRIIGGPQEETELILLAGAAGINPADIIIGRGEIGLFLNDVGDCDLIVGGDSGTLHLCSTVTPILGIFTSSPWWRFAPFGATNRILFYDVSCRPCVQFSRDSINACQTRECLGVLDVKSIVSSIFLDPDVASKQLRKGLSLAVGTSHL